MADNPAPAARKVLAIIPARGGSKGIPGKNVRLLAGKPLIAHTIAVAKAASLVNRVVVSTDDNEIAAVAGNAGAEVLRRPAEISGDDAPSEAALLHVIEQLKLTENYFPDIVVFLQCTSPLTTFEDIDGAVSALIREKADSIFSAMRFYHFLWRLQPGEGAVGINHDKKTRPMRQNREPQFLENGAIYAFHADGFVQSRHRFFGNTAIYVMPVERTLEIDEPHDFELAEIAILRQPASGPGDFSPAGAAGRASEKPRAK